MSRRLAFLGDRRPWRPAATLLAASLALLPGLTAAAPAAMQGCSEDILEALQQAWRLTPGDDILASACKPWPDDARLLLTLVVFGPKDQPVRDRTATMGIAMLDTRSSRLVSRHRQTIEEDASFKIREGTFTLDTARYRLAPGVRGFGVVSEMVNQASCPDGGLDAGWRLYAAQGKVIRPLTDTDLFLKTWRYAGPMCRDGRIQNETSLTLDVRPRPGAWADLVIRASRSDGKRPLVIGVPYDGQQYRVTDASGQITNFNWKP